MSAAPLPIDDVLPALLGALQQEACAVVQAPTGAGKTTRVPPALLGLLPGDKRVLVLEPRRVAARAAASRMAQEAGQALGQLVGYHVRFDQRHGPQTRVLVVTEGVMLRILQSDPFLEDVGAIVFDEFHERSLDADLALAMARRVQTLVRPDLKLVVMSATLDAEPVARWLDDCPVITSQGRTFPVDIQYIGRLDPRRVHEGAASGVRAAAGLTSLDILTFLPGVGEIRRTQEALEPWARQEGLELVQLYGQLSPGEQDAALRPGQGQRVILATNVAETSVTLPGVGAVVDTGLTRRMRYDPSCGLDRLELEPISQASAAQRAGRAGRVGPGLCLRLWPASTHRARPEFDTPEIQRVDLAASVLRLMAWGEQDMEDFCWFEAPGKPQLDRAMELLELLGAVHQGEITPKGQILAAWPLHPRLAALMLEGCTLGQVEVCALAAAVLSERDAFGRLELGQGPGLSGHSDVMERVLALQRLQQGRQPGARHLGPLRRGAAQQLFKVQEQLARVAALEAEVSPEPLAEPAEAVGRALLAGFPDRLALRRAAGSPRGVMVGGRGVRLSHGSVVLEAPLFVCADLDAGRRQERSEALVWMASEVRRGWLEESKALRRVQEVVYDPQRRRVITLEKTLFADLVLEEAVGPAPEAVLAASVLAQAALEELDRVIPWDKPAVANLVARVRSLARWMPELGLPSLDRASMGEILAGACLGLRSMEELARLDWVQVFLGALSWQQRQALDSEAPERLTVPSGSQIRLQYQEEGPPVLPVRIQEVFGLADTPTVAGGRVPVLMHLLAPNQRPQQVTQDLRSFWASTYTEVRKELRQRYPKHAWPEDPWNAQPERRPQRKR